MPSSKLKRKVYRQPFHEVHKVQPSTFVASTSQDAVSSGIRAFWPRRITVDSDDKAVRSIAPKTPRNVRLSPLPTTVWMSFLLSEGHADRISLKQEPNNSTPSDKGLRKKVPEAYDLGCKVISGSCTIVYSLSGSASTPKSTAIYKIRERTESYSESTAFCYHMVVSAPPPNASFYIECTGSQTGIGLCGCPARVCRTATRQARTETGDSV